MSDTGWQRLGDDLYCYPDACNVYLLRYGDRAIAVDYGTGVWRERLGEIGVRRLAHVVLTHGHRDQCCGLYRGTPGAGGARPQLHVPSGDAWLLRGPSLRTFWRDYQSGGCPSTYAAPRLPVGRLRPDMTPDAEIPIGPALFCPVATPGHTRGALSYVVEWHRRQLVFCGDAVRAGGAIHELYHLEWDHWTPGGAREAWYGLERLRGCRADALLPSHGPPIPKGASSCIRTAQRNLLRLIEAKTSVCSGERVRWLRPERTASGARRITPHLFGIGGNGYLLLNEAGRALVFDPTMGDMPALDAFVEETGVDIVTATATHYHVDHSDALDLVRQRYGAQVWLHPWVAEPLADRDRFDLPWLPPDSVTPDRLLPEQGSFRWEGMAMTILPFPGQTWWHCAIHAHVDGRDILFAGDNYHPPTRWNGTGGFCAFNGSRFAEGFARSAAAALNLTPEIVCAGHRSNYRFAASQFRRILRWSSRAEQAVAALCPSRSWPDDYDPRRYRLEPFVTRLERGGSRDLEFVAMNHGGRKQLVVEPVAAAGLQLRSRRKNVDLPASGMRRFHLHLESDGTVRRGRHLVAVDVREEQGRRSRLLAEAAVALVDVR